MRLTGADARPSQVRRDGAPAALAAGLAGPAAVALTLLAFALRVYHLSRQSLTGDEAFSMLAAERWLTGQMNLYGAGGIEPTPPLHFLALHLWTLVAGDGEFAGRYLSHAAGVLLVPTAYQLGRHLGGSRLGLAFAALCAANPFLILHSQTIRFYSLAAWLSCLSALCLVRVLAPEARPVPLGRWVAYVLTTLLVLYTHSLAVLLLAFHNLAYLAWGRRRGDWRTWLLSQVAIGVLFLPWGLRALGLFATPFDVWIERGSLPEVLYRLLATFTFGASPLSGATDASARSGDLVWTGLPLVAAAGLLFLLGVLSGRASSKGRDGGFAALYFLAPLAIALILTVKVTLLRDRYLMPFLPGYLLGVAVGVEAIGRRRLLAGLLALGVALSPAALTLPAYYQSTIFATAAQVRQLQAYVRATAKEGAVAVVNLPASDPYFQYYDLGMPTEFISDAQPSDRDEGLPRLKEAVATHREVWLIPFAYGDKGNRFVESQLNGAAFKAGESWFGNIRLVRYAVSPPAAARQPADAAFSHSTGQIRLAGYSLSSGNPAPGDALSLTLYWRPDGPTAKRYTVFTHLEDASGKTRAQQDSEPVGGQRPTTTWRSGEEIADNYGLALPSDLPPGEYRLVVGFYQLEEGTRLLLPSGENSLILATVQVGAR